MTNSMNSDMQLVMFFMKNETPHSPQLTLPQPINSLSRNYHYPI